MSHLCCRQLGDSGLSDAQNRAGAIFFVAMNFAFM